MKKIRKSYQKTAVFIDAANIELSAKDKNWRVDYRKLYKWLKQSNTIIFCGFFTVRFNTPKHDAFLTVLKKSGYHLVTKPLKLIRGNKTTGHIRKANFDVEITVEAMRRVESFEKMILFSGDSDFDYLLKELKKQRKTTVVISMKHHIAKELVKTAHDYIDLRKIRNIIERRK